MADAKKPASGMESMLRAMGLSEVLDAANTLAASGAVPQLIAFANGLPALVQQLNRIEATQYAIARQLGISVGPSSPVSGLISADLNARPDADGSDNGAASDGGGDTNARVGGATLNGASGNNGGQTQ